MASAREAVQRSKGVGWRDKKSQQRISSEFSHVTRILHHTQTWQKPWDALWGSLLCPSAGIVTLDMNDNDKTIYNPRKNFSSLSDSMCEI
jgi:hypothetical protein